MKKICYDTNIKKYIEDYNDGNFNKKDEKYRRLCSGGMQFIAQFVLSIFLAVLCVPIDLIREYTLLIFSSMALASYVISAGVQTLIYKYNKKNKMKRYENALGYLLRLGENLESNYGLKIGKEELSKAVVTSTREKSVGANLVTKQSRTKITEKSEIFILDREDKIRVLKEVRTTLKAKGDLVGMCESTLYYDEDYDLSEAPVSKRLILNK